METRGKRNAHFLLELLRGRENVWWSWQLSCHHEERERGREASREKQSGPQAPWHLFEALDLTRPAQVCPWSFSALSQLLSMLFSRQVMSESLRRRGLQHSRFLPFPVSGSVLRLKSTESVMPSSHLVLCRPLLLLPSVFPIIRVFPNKPGATEVYFSPKPA